MKKLGEVFFSSSVSRTASGEIRQNNGGLVRWQGIADFYRSVKARYVATAG
ncbi:hypothetical protein [Mucilaginibacter mallensis]|uniref:hypothetical protein n=1 Tax=Mucilaginibacter mallensis TaxID=652787 RepID=UPI0012F963DC|nr:hypothetical protein [Mucilaginibacter mallensis]